MKQKIIAFLPTKVKVFLRFCINLKSIISNYLYDIIRYLRFSSTITEINDNLQKLESLIVKKFHTIEKGLSFSEMRNLFGKKTINELFDLLQLYTDRKYDTNSKIIQASLSTIDEYINTHKKNGEIPQNIIERFNKFKKNLHQNIGGTITLSRKEIIDSTVMDFETFSNKRYSIRDYTKKNVKINVLEKAIKLAMKAPSACNRQPARVYIIDNKELLKMILDIQSGNKGFGHKANKLLIVTADLSSYRGLNERNLIYVDGGIFAMNLLYSLHNYGLAACTLNWSSSIKKDKQLRKYADIKNCENIVLLIAVGHIPKNFKIPVSFRNDSNNVIKIRG